MLDELDLAIIRELVKDGRASYRSLAKKLGISVATVASRVVTLEKSGIIKGYTALVDYEKLGYEITAIIELTISKGKLIEVQRQVAEKPNVSNVYDVTGESDSIIVARFKNREELNKFVKWLLSMPYVERTLTHLVLSIVKEDPRYPLRAEG
ncbi:MAG: Lrp/AsnC family transcriptional regulator [Thaumarchaeota archaeon]|jgi:DNA-binding Lrp family transcriptional regulator|nr:Lrp/AsnC family transcriptional regulator [Candidatus Terraquivivens yellowstonensis]MCL7387170.1 Lrp/AsnC family transcriptional regulator [Candidatus Terraquivivens yellowstonensis]MCL7392358.1 Lrp/AsnC family transcriptional regulator [Candidatus Terraquivivens yellowstonensis]MCL7397826.1 Lrp/AsnC family transcriptional regulator [Candidatus Terraquivivens yellowstonensis]MCL7400531.1 Lrp/AsnC family transcriptional regulator [Candidatus Terraquivivens yellowstonensis]